MVAILSRPQCVNAIVGLDLLNDDTRPSGHISRLTHWGRVTHISVTDLTIIGSDNGLSPGPRQAIITTNAGILLIIPLRTNFSEILIEILIFSFKMRLKVSSAKRRPFSLGLCVNAIVWSLHDSNKFHSECPSSYSVEWFWISYLLTHWGLVTHIHVMKNGSHFQSDAYMRQNYSISLYVKCSGEPRKTALGLTELNLLPHPPRGWWVNSSPPNAAYMRQWIGSALVQIMACRIFGAMPLSEPMLEYC